jgi:dipeptidyl aminopeptidase/acylaminoacyl peptidase
LEDNRPSSISTLDLVQIGQLSGLSVSPDQKFAIVRLDRDNVEQNKTDLTWYRVRLQDGKVNRVCHGGDPFWDTNGGLAGAVPQWSADGKWVYFRSLEGQQAQVVRCAADGAKREQVTQAEADVRDFIIDGSRTLHVALEGATREEIKHAESREYDAGVLMDETTIPGFPVVRSFPYNGRMATYRTLREADAVQGGRRVPLLGDRPFRFVSMQLPDRTTRPASTSTEERFRKSWSGSGFAPYDPSHRSEFVSPNGLQVVKMVRTDASTPSTAPKSRSGYLLELSDRKTGVVSVCRDRVCTDADFVSPLGWTKDGRGVVFQTTTFGTRGLHVWDPMANTVRLVISTEAELGSIMSGAFGACRTANGSSLGDVVCLESGADSPPQLVAFDLETGARRVLFDPNGSLRTRSLGVARKITIKDRWGGETYGRLLLPRSWVDLPEGARPRLPLVITSYFCPGFLTGGSGGDVPEHVLAGQGYAAVCLDMTASTVRQGEGRDWTQEKESYYQMLDFFEDAVGVLDEMGVADPRRVIVSGFSASATAVTYGLFASNRFTASIITTQGYMDPITCYLNSAQGLCREYNAKRWPLPYDSATGRYAEFSPARHVTDIRTPLLMQLADVEYQAMMQLHSAMLDYNRPVEMYVFPDEYHHKRQPRHRLAVYNRNFDWIEFWLRGVERDTTEQSQYARWREMRVRQCQLFGENPVEQQPWYCKAA